MTAPGKLLFRIVGLLAVLVAGLAATARTHSSWLLVATIVALIVAAGAVAQTVNALLGQDDLPEPRDGARRTGALFAGAAVLGIAAAIVLPIETSAAVSATSPDARAAAATVRAFLANAVLDQRAYAACQYLTPSAQDRIARVAGDGQTCRDALTATVPAFAGVGSEGSLRALDLRAVVHGDRAVVTTDHVAFVLQRTTPPEAAAFQTPSTAWRIVSGETAVLPGLSGHAPSRL